MVHGIGVDIVSKKSICEALERNKEAFLKFVFTEEEIGYACETHDMISHLSAFFAAKESVIKSLGTGWKGGLRLTDIEVSHTVNGAPEINLSGNALKLSHSLGGVKVLVSLSIEDLYVIANAIAVIPSDGSHDE